MGLNKKLLRLDHNSKVCLCLELNSKPLLRVDHNSKGPLRLGVSLKL